MTAEELKKRTKEFSLRVMRLVDALPRTKSGDVLGKQLLRSATSVGANYRSACRAKSKADFIYKINIVEEEADESLYWLELIEEADLVGKPALAALRKEASELTAIFTATGKSAKSQK